MPVIRLYYSGKRDIIISLLIFDFVFIKREIILVSLVQSHKPFKSREHSLAGGRRFEVLKGFNNTTVGF